MPEEEKASPKQAEVAHPHLMADASWELLHIMSH